MIIKFLIWVSIIAVAVWLYKLAEKRRSRRLWSSAVADRISLTNARVDNEAKGGK